MRTYCFHCNRLIRIENPDNYVCPRCHAKSIAVSKNNYATMTDKERDIYWNSYKNEIKGNTLDKERILSLIFLSIMGIALISGISYAIYNLLF